MCKGPVAGAKWVPSRAGRPPGWNAARRLERGRGGECSDCALAGLALRPSKMCLGSRVSAERGLVPLAAGLRADGSSEVGRIMC